MVSMNRFFFSNITAALLVSRLLVADEGKETNFNSILESLVAKNAYNKVGVVCSSANPYPDKENFAAHLDVLYWHAKANGTIYGYRSEKPQGESPIQGPIEELKFNWDWGFRLGGEYNLSYDGFSLELLYTHFNTNKTNANHGKVISPFIPVKSIYLFNRYVTEAKSTGDISLNSLDFQLSRETFLSPFFTFSPYAGLKNSWLRFKQNTSYSGGSYLGVNSVYVKDKTNFWGIGPKIGSNMQWFIGNGFNIFGDLYCALQYGIFNVSYEDRLSNSSTDQVKLKSQSHQFSPLLSIALGGSWGSYINQCAQFLEFSLAYEGQMWFNQNQNLQVYDADISRIQNISDNISMHGLTITATVNF